MTEKHGTVPLMEVVLSQCLAFPFQQTMTSLGALELSLHGTKRLSRGKDSLFILK